MPYYWIPERISAIREVLKFAKNYPEAAKILCTEYGIKATGENVRVQASYNKISRPFISANWGGKRR
jgi:hypothetical protein